MSLQPDIYTKFDELTFDDFRRLAKEPDLSRHEKVGFPDTYRDGKEDLIFQDVQAKLTNLKRERLKVLEIGPGCSQLPIKLAELCQSSGSELLFVDSEEMLALLPDAPHITKIPGPFPTAMDGVFEEFLGKVDVVIAYSVIQYVFQDANLWDFTDRCMELLSPGGEILFGDIPNSSMRKRFLASEEGLAFHRRHFGNDSRPPVEFSRLERGKIDDSVVLGLLARARSEGFHAWSLPQEPSLPMANRREDVLIRRP